MHAMQSTELRDLPIQVHHGVLAVQQDLADLEPLDEDDDEGSALASMAAGAEGEGGGPLLETDVDEFGGGSGGGRRSTGPTQPSWLEGRDLLSFDGLSAQPLLDQQQLGEQQRNNGQPVPGVSVQQQFQDLLL